MPLTGFILILAIVFQPENTTEGILCSKLTEIHLIALLLYQYKASTKKYKQCMIGKEDNKYLLNAVFSALSFLLAPFALLLLRRSCARSFLVIPRLHCTDATSDP